ncbi:biotin--[acetyl-CoA-carboxylase] ligase [Atopomonas sediminilitoris]|uniref:biotin--[acetyl-CoA-carboxylase] ligase n=1 Tax=Atopomonas sediminilitoris TaxID=2919919 RepID=UPI001F4E31B7|nr:biotin--[acetyl-CoA-carboxylase] ligase [Atopomonas sediminilitoris]MCJ8170925.1 biotin--[acetyl-CoA-carboxylase] ligase [Atopomonas sediminilitoris]
MLGVSRAAVWKQIQQIEADFDIVVDRVRGKGYRLASPIDLYRADIAALAKVPLYVHWALPSTNSVALQCLADGKSAPMAVLAERQTAGRGRRGRGWESGFAENLCLTYVHPMQGGAARVEGASLAIGCAVVRVLRGIGVPSVQLKWPNDVITAQGKLAGILIELHGDLSDCFHLVIGVGVNVNARHGIEVDQPWTSCRRLTGKSVDRSSFALEVIEQVQTVMRQFDVEGFAAFKDEWLDNAAWLGEQVELSGGAVIAGTLMGIDQRGALIVATDEGQQVVAGGELSLRRRQA